ncbi:MAG: hypothetical protein CMP20_09180 [Rickettsiales bacterium]|nr:hypothetical protein [Rickettsiales bacterium]
MQNEFDVFVCGAQIDFDTRSKIADSGKAVAENYLHVADLIVEGKRNMVDEALEGTDMHDRAQVFLQKVETIAAFRQTLRQVYGIKKPVYGLLMANLHDRRLVELSQAASNGDQKVPPLKKHKGDQKSGKKQSKQVFEVMRQFYAGNLPYQICFIVSRVKGGGKTATVAVAQPNSFANTTDLGNAHELFDITTLDFCPVWQPTEPRLPENATAITKGRMQGIDYDGKTSRTSEQVDKIRAICLTAILKTKLMFTQRIDNPRQLPVVVDIQAVVSSNQPVIKHEFADVALKNQQQLERVKLQYETVASSLADDTTAKAKAARKQALGVVARAEKYLERPTRILKTLERYVNDGFWGENRLPVLVCYQDVYPHAPIWFALRVLENDTVSALTEELDRLDNFVREGEIPKPAPKRSYADVVSDSG